MVTMIVMVVIVMMDNDDHDHDNDDDDDDPNPTPTPAPASPFIVQQPYAKFRMKPQMASVAVLVPVMFGIFGPTCHKTVEPIHIYICIHMYIYIYQYGIPCTTLPPQNVASTQGEVKFATINSGVWRVWRNYLNLFAQSVCATMFYSVFIIAVVSQQLFQICNNNHEHVS